MERSPHGHWNLTGYYYYFSFKMFLPKYMALIGRHTCHMFNNATLTYLILGNCGSKLFKTIGCREWQFVLYHWVPHNLVLKFDENKHVDRLK